MPDHDSKTDATEQVFRMRTGVIWLRTCPAAGSCKLWTRQLTWSHKRQGISLPTYYQLLEKKSAT